MGTIDLHAFTSLDGVVDADGDWQFPYFDAELFGWVSAAWERAGSVLLGRASFEGYERLRAGHPDSPVLAFLDSVPVHVVSTTMPGAPRDNVSVVGRDVAGHVRDLRARTESTVLELGSPTLSRWLLGQDLLDHLDLMVLPVIVGSGTRLFLDGTARPSGLRLRSTRSLSSGAVQLDYAVG